MKLLLIERPAVGVHLAFQGARIRVFDGDPVTSLGDKLNVPCGGPQAKLEGNERRCKLVGRALDVEAKRRDCENRFYGGFNLNRLTRSGAALITRARGVSY
jgi:hypothetical protein